MFENTLRTSPQLTIEFSAQTAKVAQKSGYKLTSFATTHSLEFAEPPRRRIDNSPQTQIMQPNPSHLRSNAMEAYTRAMEEADSFLNVNNLQESLTTSSQPPPPNTDSQPINLSSQTTSTQTTSKSPQPRLHFNPQSPSTSEIGLAPLQQPPDELKAEREGLVHKIKTEKEEPTHYFELLYQPNEKQRKSYKNENRYILPNPLTIVLNKHMKEKKVKVDKGTVTVGLLYDTGEELEENREHILDGVKTRTLDKEKKAQFHLKVVETSDRNRFRLQFVVRFFINKVEHIEKIVSHCFRVTSNKKSASIEKPRPFAIKPSYGPTSCETEVWIRGKLFTDRANTSVTFGGKPARVIETEDNILVCYAPAREDLVEDCTVEVKVTNHKGDQTESLDASKILEFTYLSERKRKRIKKETNESNEIPKDNNDAPILKETESSVLYCPPSPSAYPQLDDIVKNEAELIDRLGYFFPSYFPMEAS